MSRHRLEAIIREKIDTEGPITFETFMEMALYHPEQGYYRTGDVRLGPEGDFYTAPHLHPVFGRLLSVQLDDMRTILGEPDLFTIVEFGAGRGYLAADIIECIRNTLKWKENWRYLIVDPDPHSIQDQKKRLARHQGRVGWRKDIGQVDPFCGCVISNELLDAFPVHRVFMADRFQEVYVSIGGNGFREIYADFSTPELSAYLKRYGVFQISGYRTEVNLRARAYLENIANVLREGFVVSIDYGYSSRQYYAPERSAGTLLCYYQHTPHDNPYIHIGNQDITAHVNFTALKDWGETLGLRTIGYAPQGPFLAALGSDERISREFGTEEMPLEARLKLKNLLFDMGDSHQVMIQYKGRKNIRPLKGFALGNRVKTLTP